MTRFRVLVADPPWRFSDRLPGKRRGAAKNYRVMTLDEIRAFPLPPMHDDAILFLWRVSSQVEEAYSVVRAWGFVPKSEIVWRKLSVTRKLHFGMGRYVRASHETCIIATRGRFKVESRSVRSVFEAPVPREDGRGRRIRHSAKPEIFYEIVESLAKGPYCEMFARTARAGWTAYGDELPGAEPRPRRAA